MPMHTIAKSIALSFALLACTSPPRTVEIATPAADAAQETSCAASWTGTADWAAALAREPSNYLNSGGPIALAESPIDLDTGDPAIEEDLLIARDSVRLESEVIPEASLEEQLARNFKRTTRINNVTDPGHVPKLFLGIARDTPWSRVVDMVQLARRAGFTRVSFWFRRAKPMQAPGWSWRDPLIKVAKRAFYYTPDDYIPPPGGDRRPPSLAQRGNLLSTFAACPELVRRVKEESHEELVASLARFDEPCRCRIDQASLRAILWAVHPADGSTLRTLTIQGPDDSTSGAVTIAAAADASWSEVAAQVIALPTNTPARFAVSP
jgi:hypothetical protein